MSEAQCMRDVAPTASSDPAGGGVVQVSGGVFQVEADGPTRITRGTLVAIGADRALVHECDEDLTCDYFLVDRSNSSRTPLVLSESLGEQPVLFTLVQS